MSRIKISPADRLAARIESDIRSRGLSPGDPYLTAQETSALMGVSPTTCHRALRLLAERDIVHRRRNSGTFVGPKMQTEQPALVQSVFVLISSDRPVNDTLLSSLTSELWRAMPGVGLHQVMLPIGSEVRYLESLLTPAARAGQLSGVVAISSPTVYRYLAQQAYPTVVIGSVDSMHDKLTSVSGDERNAGYALADHMLAKGYRQLLVLMDKIWRPGDNLFLRGVEEAMERAKLSAGSLRVRSLPCDSDLLAQQVGAIVGECSDRVAVICQEPMFFPWLQELQSRDTERYGNLGVAYNANLEAPTNDNKYPCVYLKASPREMVAIAGQMLAKLCAGEPLAERHIVLPMSISPGVNA